MNNRMQSLTMALDLNARRKVSSNLRVFFDVDSAALEKCYRVALEAWRKQR